MGSHAHTEALRHPKTGATDPEREIEQELVRAIKNWRETDQELLRD